MIQPSISVIIPTIRLDKALMALLAQLGDMDILKRLLSSLIPQNQFIISEQIVPG